MIRPVKVAIIIVVVVPILLPSIVWATGCFGLASTGECAYTLKPLSRDAAYMGGATLIGLATFGSILGARAITGRDEKTEYLDAMLMVGGA